MGTKESFMMLQFLVMSQPLEPMIEECISQLKEYILLDKPVNEFPTIELYKLLLKTRQLRENANFNTIMKEANEVSLIMDLADQVDKSSQQ